MSDIKEKYENLLTLDEVLDRPFDEIRQLAAKHANADLYNVFDTFGTVKDYVKAEGCNLWDADGNKYLDFLAGIASVSIGHNNKEVYAAIDKAFGLPCILQTTVPRVGTGLANALAALAPGNLNKVWLGAHGGAEAVEGAIKIAELASKKHKFVSTDNSYHGKTRGAVSVTGRKKWSKDQATLENVEVVPFGNAEALEEVLKKGDVAAFFIEPIQGEGGVNVPPEGYLKKVRELCTKYDVLFVADEIQSGVGRTGTFFAVEGEDVVPDIIVFAKGISGGLLPLGGYITNDEVWNKAFGTIQTCTLHTTTFNNDTLCSAVGLATIEYMLKNDVLESVKEKGEYLMSKLNEIKDKYPCIKEVRGKGLFVGVEFQPVDSLAEMMGAPADMADELLGTMMCNELISEYNILVSYTLNQARVIRVTPPLVVSYEELDYFLQSFESAIAKNMDLLGIELTTA